MLIKTEEFDRTFHKDFHQIIVNKRLPIKISGSYKLKPNGTLITDIDLSQHVYANEGLVRILAMIVSHLKKPVQNGFIFTRLHCGMYREFTLPWEVDNIGSCSFDLKKAQEWYTSLREKNIMSEAVYDRLYKIFFIGPISLHDLLEVKELIRPFSEILWDEKDIQRGYKTHLGQKYTLVELMRAGRVTVMRFLYKYTDKGGRDHKGGEKTEYVSIDFSLVDKQYAKPPTILHEYYKGNVYKIFKSYKWYLQNEYYPEYIEIMKSLEPYTAFLNRIKLISNVMKYGNIIPERDLAYLIQNAKHYGKNVLGVEYSPQDQSSTEKILQSKVREICEKNREYFRQRIKSNFEREVTFYELRSQDANFSVSLEKLEENNSGCPFFFFSLKTFRDLLNLAERALMKHKTVITCVKDVSNMVGVNPDIFVESVFTKNNLYLRKEVIDEKDVYFLMERGNKISEISTQKEFKKAQIRILMQK